MKQLFVILRSVYSKPYNRIHFLFAFYRCLLWKYIRSKKITNYEIKIWNNRKALLHYDSIQCMWLIFNYIIDWEEFHLISAIVKKDDIVFDVGANVGFYSLWISKYNKNGVTYAFEPDVKNFDRLKQNILLNELEHTINLNKVGIADKKGKLYFTTGEDVLNHLSINAGENITEVNVTSIDEYCCENNVKKIKYFKIDIEGFELAAFRGAEGMLSKGLIDIVQLEINSSVQNANSTESEVVNYLESFGYKLAAYNIAKRRLELIDYKEERENYFAVKDIDKMNQQLLVAV